MLLFEWNSEKAKKNTNLHGVSFDEASTVFKDKFSLSIFDPLHSENEDRFIIIGNSYKNRTPIVIYTERGNIIRIISARRSTKKERLQYEENARG